MHLFADQLSHSGIHLVLKSALSFLIVLFVCSWMIRFWCLLGCLQVIDQSWLKLLLTVSHDYPGWVICSFRQSLVCFIE